MSLRKIESNKVGKVVKLTNKCTSISDDHNDIMVGSGKCKSCKWFSGIENESVNCKFKRLWT